MGTVGREPDKYCLHTVDGVLHIIHDNLNKLDEEIYSMVYKKALPEYLEGFFVNLLLKTDSGNLSVDRRFL